MSIPLTKDNNKDYEHIKVDKKKLKEKRITGYVRTRYGETDGWSFSSLDPIIKKQTYMILEGNYEKKEKFIRDKSTVIPDLRCPDCSACAHYTDIPNVATCCSPIGWFFFYRKLDQDIASKAKLVIRNGEMVLEEGQDKSESSF